MEVCLSQTYYKKNVGDIREIKIHIYSKRQTSDLS